MMKPHNGLILLLILTALSADGMDFGNIAVFPDKYMDELPVASVSIGNSLESMKLLSRSGVIFWNLESGSYRVCLKSPAGDIIDSIQIAVFPYLTSKITVSYANDRIVLKDNGFADQAGHILTFDKEAFRSLPGELEDNIGVMALVNDIGFHRNDRSWFRRRDEFSNTARNLYSLDNLLLSGISRDIDFGFSGVMQPDLAMVNLSDPFAGHPESEINLICGYGVSDRATFESVYGSRRRRNNRVAANINLPAGNGRLYGSAAVDNLDDAYPRYNTDGVLPHNSLDGDEYLLGGNISLSQRFKSDFRLFYKKLCRDIYSHHYYFGPSHAPHEEGYFYKGRVAVSGIPSRDFIIEAGFRLEGDEYEHGSGFFFDEIPSYFEYVPSYDKTFLFWSWDDIDGITEDIDESMVYDEYNREYSRSWGLDIGLKKIFIESIELSAEFLYTKSSFRRLNHVYPIDQDTLNVDYFGFDLYGHTVNDDNGIMDIPRPEEWQASLGFRRPAENYFLCGSIDFRRFDPGYFAFKDIYNTYGDDGILDKSDIKEAEAKSECGYRLAGGLSVQDNATLFGNYAVRYSPPIYTYLYNGYSFLSFKLRGSDRFVFGNAELDMEKSRSYEIGLQLMENDDIITVSYRHEEITDYFQIRRITDASPASYMMYSNSGRNGKYDSDIYLITYQGKGRPFLTWTLAGGIVDSRYTDKALAGLIHFVPGRIIKERAGIMSRIADAFSIDMSFLYKSGIRYTRASPEYDPVSLVETQFIQAGPTDGEKARDFLEISIGLSARLFDFLGGQLIIRGEIINATDRENYMDVYPATGLPDETGWLQTEEGQAWQILFNEPHDASGLTGEEKYRLASDNPNNFGRPRMFRIIARLEF